MPRKRPADRRGPVKTRSRDGCNECRASRVRCDIKKPVCTRCWEKGLVCSRDFALKWRSEFASRGRAFGRAGVWSKSGAKSPASSTPEAQEWCLIPYIEPWAFVNVSVSTFEQPHLVDAASGEDNTLANQAYEHHPGLANTMSTQHDLLFGQFTSPLASLSLHPAMSNGGRLFEYYFRQVCPRTTASSKASSPFASVILPFCLSSSASPALMKAIEALGACHWSRFDSSHHAVALHSKSMALQDLSRQLVQRGSLACSADPEIMVIMMMLCLYEIVDNCDQHWTIHLKGAKQLIKLRRQQAALPGTNPIADPVSSFAEQFFAFQDVMGRTACGEEILFGSDYWQGNDHSIDPWMGCSHELAAILSSITELSRTRKQLGSDAARSSFLARAASLEHGLDHLVQEVDDDDTLQSAAELKRLAAVLYLHCALYGATPNTPLVVDHVCKILSLVSSLLENDSLASMTWPVFVAAVELNPSHDELWSDCNDGAVHGRPLVLRALSVMAESTVSNVSRTRAVIVKVWQARDVDMLKATASTDTGCPPGCNDWEWYIAPISTAMSLA